MKVAQYNRIWQFRLGTSSKIKWSINIYIYIYIYIHNIKLVGLRNNKMYVKSVPNAAVKLTRTSFLYIFSFYLNLPRVFGRSLWTERGLMSDVQSGRSLMTCLVLARWLWVFTYLFRQPVGSAVQSELSTHCACAAAVLNYYIRVVYLHGRQ